MSQLDDLVRLENANSALAFREHAYRMSDRAKLLRDLIALANAAVRGPRFLFVGVRDIVGGERKFCGITERAWSELKHLLTGVLANAIDPPLKVQVRALEIENALIGMLCVSECEDPPYLLSAQAGDGLMPGTGWVRRATKVLPLLRPDLQRLFEVKAAGSDGAADVRIGFAPDVRTHPQLQADAEALRDEIVLAVLPLEAVPSAVAAEKLHALLAAKAGARAVLGRTETHLSRLVHAKLFGPDFPYQTHSDDSLRAQIAGAHKEYRGADAHYEFEVRAHPLQVLVSNRNGTALHAATLALKLPRLEGTGVAEQRYPAADAAPSHDGYPIVHTTAHTIGIHADIGVVPQGATIAAFRHAPRFWVREQAAGRTIPVDYTLHARELREPLRDTLLIKID
jgi:hypothetical protein